ncbi:VanZ family protein [Actinoplanes sp. ATCC 53533]|uniref:VanZ family protein n=1 Tax=Actinoplanes sp. ATCC 53533 TaxID=1288362 RepID=UPI000F7799FA|nr:VanZ family protein [Actinoplanes sp. ATCC 53533]RSM72331.1 VanZ family protein [Actinoplanes sp. ATCC 53533]
MPSHQLDVPALPILLPLGGVLMVVSWLLLHRRGLLSARRLTTAWLAGWYAVAVIGATMLPLHLAWGPGAGPPDLYRIILVPLVTMRVDDFLLNVVMMLPLAALLFLVAGVRERVRVVLVGFLTSLVIEVAQAVIDIAWHGNRWADVNDLTSNTVGAWLGFLIFWRIMRRARVRRAVRGWSLTRAEAEAAPAHRPVTRS